MKKKKEINWVRWRWLRQHLKHTRKSSLPEEPQAKIVHFMTSFIATIPLITAGLYLSGMAYHYGECAVYGLDIVEFPWPSDIILSMGFLLLSDAIKTYLWPILGMFICVLLLIVTLFFCIRLRLGWAWLCHRISLLKYPKVKRFLRRRAHLPAPRLYLLLIWMKIFYDRFAILVLTPMVVFSLSAFSLNSGNKAALEQVKKLESGQLTSQTNKATSPLLGDAPHMRLMCNTTYCAYRIKGGKMKLIRHDQVEFIHWNLDQQN
jgi:hypothetical protein